MRDLSVEHVACKMTKSSAEPVLPTLADLRVEIDRIDSEMHQLLMQRGEIIDHLMAVKARQGGGSAFRPGREADMMRSLVARHKGLLPVDTVESIWRIIISTFTFVQANYSVHADVSGGDAIMRDSVRFHFGFTVPFLIHHSASGVVEAVGRSGGDLGMVRANSGTTAGAWWLGLIPEKAPKIIARLPFVERPDHPAGLPVFLVANPLAEAAATEVKLYAVALEHWNNALPAMIGEKHGEIIGNSPVSSGLSLLVSLPGDVSLDEIKDLIGQHTAAASDVTYVGSHAARYELA